MAGALDQRRRVVRAPRPGEVEDDAQRHGAKAYFVHSNNFEIYALGGSGIFRVSAEGEDEALTTVHLGIGGEIGLGRRAYLRPEVRSRWDADELRFEDGIVDYSLGLGLRF